MPQRAPVLAVVCLVLAACGGTRTAAGATPATSAASPPTSSGVSASASGGVVPSTASKRPDILVTAVGDSIPYGRDDCGRCESFPELFGDWIRSTTGRTVGVANLSQHDSNTAARMAVELPGNASLEQQLAVSDVIIVTIGHNDTPWNALDDSCDGSNGFFDGNAKASWSALVGPCLKTEVDRYRRNLSAILDEIVRLRAGAPTAYRFTTQYSDIPGDPCCPAEATQVAAT
jgi:lysophospholipase L1-like esterase